MLGVQYRCTRAPLRASPAVTFDSRAAPRPPPPQVYFGRVRPASTPTAYRYDERKSFFFCREAGRYQVSSQVVVESRQCPSHPSHSALYSIHKPPLVVSSFPPQLWFIFCVFFFFLRGGCFLGQVSFLFSDRGTPDGYRHMNGYGSHTFKNVNAQGNAVRNEWEWGVGEEQPCTEGRICFFVDMFRSGWWLRVFVYRVFLRVKSPCVCCC